MYIHEYFISVFVYECYYVTFSNSSCAGEKMRCSVFYMRCAKKWPQRPNRLELPTDPFPPGGASLPALARASQAAQVESSTRAPRPAQPTKSSPQ
jgi:hypothetical protein